MMRRGLGLAVAVMAMAVAPAALAAGMPTVLHISVNMTKAARASLDGAPAVAAPGAGSVNVPTLAGKHVLKVTTAAGVTYTKALNLQPANLFKWKGRGYWCVNLMDRDLQVYSVEDCNEEVADAG